MLEIRPIAVNKEMIVLGGNMRLKACIQAGLKEVFIIVAENLTKEQEREFLIKDNISGGDWDWDILANKWEAENLIEWGLDVWNDSSLNFEDESENKSDDENNKKFKIVLEYSEINYNKVIDLFDAIGGTKEEIVFKLLSN